MKNSSNISSKTIAWIAQWEVQLTCIQEVAGLNLAGKQNTFAHPFLKVSFDTTVTWHSKQHQARWRHWCREKTVNSCCTFLSKPRRQTVDNHLSCGFNSSLSQTYFWTILEHIFFISDHNCFFTHAGGYSTLCIVGNTDTQISKVHSYYDTCSFTCC